MRLRLAVYEISGCGHQGVVRALQLVQVDGLLLSASHNRVAPVIGHQTTQIERSTFDVSSYRTLLHGWVRSSSFLEGTQFPGERRVRFSVRQSVGPFLFQSLNVACNANRNGPQNLICFAAIDGGTGKLSSLTKAQMRENRPDTD
jgi:hypothetical protein